MPILIMPPDMRADTLDGASGCAWGSQECSGMIPGLRAKSEEREDEARGGDGGSKVMRTEITEAEGTAHAVGHEQEARHDENEAHVRDDEVEPTAPNGVLVLLDNDKEVARKGHELKGDQEPEHVVGDGDEHHRGDRRCS